MIFEDVLWLKIFIYTSFRLPDCSLQRVVIKYNDYRRLRFTITGYTPTVWFPKSLRFSPPGSHPIFKRIMERTSIHCMRARISICHEQIRTTNHIVSENRRKLSTLISEELFARFSQFLKSRATSVQNNIKTRHEKKLKSLSNESTSAGPIIDSSKWVINLSSKPLTSDERAILNKGPKFAPTPPKIPPKF